MYNRHAYYCLLSAPTATGDQDVTVRRRTIYSIGLTLVGLAAILYVISSTLLLNSSVHLEEANTQQNITRALADLLLAAETM